MNAVGIIQALLDVLPDSYHGDTDDVATLCWTWCWEELNDAAQKQVKQARAFGQDYLKKIQER